MTTGMRIVVTSFLIAIAVGSPAATQDNDVLRIWKVGSPFDDRSPRVAMPAYLSEAAEQAGLRVAVETFAGHAFAAAYADAASRGTLPDMLVVAHPGQIDGALLPKGRVAGVAEDPEARRHLIRLDGIYHELISVGGGVVFLHDSSPNHRVVRDLVLRPPTNCLRWPEAIDPDGAAVAARVAAAHLEEDDALLQAESDPFRLTTPRTQSRPVDVRWSQECRSWAAPRLAFVHVAATYESDAALGHASVLVVLRKADPGWKLLTVTRGLGSSAHVVMQIMGLASEPWFQAPLRPDTPNAGLPLRPAVLTTPEDGRFPFPPFLQEFGAFQWTSSPSPEVAAEIVEFAGRGDARLVLARRGLLDLTGSLSAREAPMGVGDWRWRVWSFTRDGDVVFSDVRTYSR